MISRRIFGAAVLAFALSGPGAAGAAEAQFADLPGVRIAYHDTGGAGEAVVFVHALAGTSESWKHQIEAFTAAGYRVVTYDRRGWGKSLAVPETGDQPGVSSVDLDALRDHLGIDRFHLVGIAGGSFVSMDYAALHPDHLLSLTLAASTGSIKEPEIVEFSAAIADPNVKWPAISLEVGASYVGSNRAGMAEWEEIFHSARQDGAPFQPLSEPNTFAKLDRIEVPSLVLAAGADQLAPPALMRIWAAHLKGHEWALIPEAGHSVAWENPEEFNRIVLGFIDKH